MQLNLLIFLLAFGDPIWKKAGYVLSVDWELSILPIQRNKLEAENKMIEKGIRKGTLLIISWMK